MSPTTRVLCRVCLLISPPLSCMRGSCDPSLLLDYGPRSRGRREWPRAPPSRKPHRSSGRIGHRARPTTTHRPPRLHSRVHRFGYGRTTYGQPTRRLPPRHHSSRTTPPHSLGHRLRSVLRPPSWSPSHVATTPIKPHLSERQRRLWMGTEARELGYGGVGVLADAPSSTIYSHPHPSARAVPVADANAPRNIISTDPRCWASWSTRTRAVTRTKGTE